MFTIDGYCWLCHQSLHIPRHGICSFCFRQLPKLANPCRRCAMPLNTKTMHCQHCQTSPPPWECLVTIAPYENPLKVLIRQFKFHLSPQIAYSLARLFLLHWKHEYRQQQWQKPTLICTIPSHQKRCWQRGFDHIASIAIWLAKWLNCRYEPQLLKQRKFIQTQHTLPKQARQKNRQNVFVLNDKISVQQHCVALFDDILTTGTTMRTASNLLSRAGAKTIQAWCLCRTL